MFKVISGKTWQEVATRARSAERRMAAVAYVTTNDIGLVAGDRLITDASLRCIRAGNTDAKLLMRLHDIGVEIHSSEGLHSKVAIFGNYAVIGSSNMSGSTLIEMSLITDHPKATAGVAAFIERLSTRRTRLSRSDLTKLCAVKVVRGGYRPKAVKRALAGQVGDKNWIVSVRELKKQPTPSEQARIDRKIEQLNKRLGAKDDYSWISWRGKGRFSSECRGGDNLFEVYRALDRKMPTVTRNVRVVLKAKEPALTRFYTQASNRASDTVSWSRFLKILKAAGYSRRVTQNSILQINDDIAKAIQRNWLKVR